MGFGGISVWQLVIILIVFLVTLIAVVPHFQVANKKREDHPQDVEHREEDGSGDSH